MEGERQAEPGISTGRTCNPQSEANTVGRPEPPGWAGHSQRLRVPAAGPAGAFGEAVRRGQREPRRRWSRAAGSGHGRSGVVAGGAGGVVTGGVVVTGVVVVAG